MPKANLDSYEQFRKELIRRFFNSKSYFFLCLSTQLQDTSNIATDISEDDYLIIGQVMQHLIDAQYPEEDLQEFKILDRFNDFHHTLNECLHHLHQPGLTPDDMKQTIEGLANDFVEALIDVIHEPVEKNRLLGILKTEKNELPPTLSSDPEPSLTELNETVLEKFDFKNARENEWSSTDEAEAITDLNSHKPSSEKISPPEKSSDSVTHPDGSVQQPQNPVEQVPDEKQNPDGGLKFEIEFGEEKENVEPASGIEGSERELDVEPQTSPTNESHKAEMPVHQAIRPREPDELNLSFQNEAEAFIGQISNVVGKLSPDSQHQQELKHLEKLFLDLRESGMIHGFEELENLARKAQNLTGSLIRFHRPFPKNLHALFADLPRLLRSALSDPMNGKSSDQLFTFSREINKALLAPFSYEPPNRVMPPEDLDHFDLSQIEKEQVQTTSAGQGKLPAGPDAPQATANSTPAQARKKPVEEATHEDWLSDEEKDQQETSDSSGSETAFRDDQSRSGPSQEDIDSEFFNDVFIPEPDEQDIAEDDLRLPGEDDPELLQLIQEVSDHPAGSVRPEKKIDDELAKELDQLVQLPLLKPSPTRDESILMFRKEAKLYFRVILEALYQLSENGRDRLALENLELAAYSLKGLARKLGIEPFGRFPELIEELIGKLILWQQPISMDMLKTITRGLTFLNTAADRKDIEKNEYHEAERQVIKYIHSLAASPDSHPGADLKQKENSGKDKALTKNIPGREGKFKLKGRYPRPISEKGLSPRDTHQSKNNALG